MKLRRTKRMPAAAKRKLRAKRLAQAKRFLREHTWGVMITVLILIALVLFVCVIAGASPKAPAEPETAQDDTPRYESGFICAITTQVPYYDEEFSEAGTVARGMQITYSTDKSVEHDGVRYYLTYFSTLDCGYVSEENLTQDPDAVIPRRPSTSARRRTCARTRTCSSSGRWSKRGRSCRF